MTAVAVTTPDVTVVVIVAVLVEVPVATCLHAYEILVASHPASMLGCAMACR
jgi:hypothetical protein